MTDRINRFLFVPIRNQPVALFRSLLCLLMAFFFCPLGLGMNSILNQFPLAASFFKTVVLSPFYFTFFCALLVYFAWNGKNKWAGIAILFLASPVVFANQPYIGRTIALLVFFSALFLPGVSWNEKFQGDAGAVKRSPIWPLRLIQIQLTLLYGVNAVAKTTPAYLSGDVLRTMSVTLPNFLADFGQGFELLGILTLPLWCAAVASVVIEYFLALGFWFRKTRLFCAWIGLTFHLFLTQIVAIGGLDVISLFLYCAFLLPFDTTEPHHP